MERDTILLSWNLGPKVNSRNRPKFLRETRLVAYQRLLSLPSVLDVRDVDDDAGEEIGKEDAYKPERMTTLTSFSSLEISDLEVKGLILSLFQVLFFLWFVGEYLKVIS